MTLDMKDGSSTARWRNSWQIATRCSFCSGVRSLGTNFAATRCMFKSHVKIVCTVQYDTLTIVAMSLMVPRRSSCTSHWIVSTFLGVELVEGRPDLSSSSSDVLPLLKRACRSKHLARLMSLFLYARRIISKVSAPDLPSFTQNLMFALCSSFTSMLKLQMWRRTWWQTLVLCNSQCSHSDATRHAEWWRFLLPSTAHSFTYCHRLAVCGTSLETFWYTLVRMIFIAKCVTITRFFHCLCSTLMENHDFYCSVIPWNCTWYCTIQVLYCTGTVQYRYCTVQVLYSTGPVLYRYCILSSHYRLSRIRLKCFNLLLSYVRERERESAL